MVSEIATQKQIHDEVKVHLVLKGVVHVDDKVTGNHGQKLKLVHHAWYTFLRDDSCFGHLLHRKLIVLILFGLHSPHLAKATATHCVNLVELSFRGWG